MNTPDISRDADVGQGQRLATLERLLAIKAVAVKPALDQASQLVAGILDAEKVDAFLYEPATDSLVAMGTSDTPMGRRQIQLGLDRLPLSNGGRSVDVYQTGQCYHTGHADQDPGELRGVKEGLGVRSVVAVPIDVEGQRRGVLQVDSSRPDHFSAHDLEFLEGVGHWVGLVAHRAELVERVTHEAAEQARRLAANEMITILAHDLRGPLAPLAGRIDLIHRRAARDGLMAYQKDAEAATRVVNRLQHMIADLLDTARLDQGLFGVEPAPVDLASLARETAETMRGADAAIDVRVPEELVVEADPNRLRQALENLLGNARAHSPAGVPVVLQMREESRADGAWAVVTVRDAGPGIPAELLPRLFTRFGAGPRTKGLGLGLYLARGIAEAHGGTLTVDTAPGQGAAFHLALPVAERPPR